MQQSEFNFSGKQLSEIGQQLAIDTADAIIPNWSNDAYKLVCDYAKMYGSIPFRAEEVRSYAAQIDFPLPKNGRAWGAVFTRAAREKVIKSIGYAKVSNPKAHATPAALWVRA